MEDDGETIAFLGANGVDFDTNSRMSTLADLLTEYGVFLDEGASVIHSNFCPEESIPALTVRFSGLMLRVYDLIMLATTRVRSTFREDLLRFVGAISRSQD